MLDTKTYDQIKRLDELVKKLSLVTDNGFVLFPSEDTLFDLPSDKYYEIIQQIFNNRSPLNATIHAMTL